MNPYRPREENNDFDLYFLYRIRYYKKFNMKKKTDGFFLSRWYYNQFKYIDDVKDFNWFWCGPPEESIRFYKKINNKPDLSFLNSKNKRYINLGDDSYLIENIEFISLDKPTYILHSMDILNDKRRNENELIEEYKERGWKLWQGYKNL